MTTSHAPAVLAIELAAPATTPLRLPTEEAAWLLDAVAADLARLLPDAASLGLALAAALFDPTQLLRPAWPVFAELAALYRQQRRGDPTPTLIAFGTAGGRMATTVLEPEPALAGGVMLAIPFALAGDAAIVDACAERMDRVFEAEGLAGAAVARFLGEALGVTVVHAHYFTHHDLAAFTAIQLEHGGMAVAWPLIEAALLSPHRDEVVRAPAGQPWLYRAGEVRAQARTYREWARDARAPSTPDARRAAWLDWQREQRAFAALLAAHGLPPRWCTHDGAIDAAAVATTLATAPVLAEPWRIESIATPAGGAATRVLAAHADDALGVVAISVLEASGTTWRMLALGWPLTADALRPLCAALAAPHGIAAHPLRAGAFEITGEGDAVTLPGGITPPDA